MRFDDALHHMRDKGLTVRHGEIRYKMSQKHGILSQMYYHKQYWHTIEGLSLELLLSEEWEVEENE